MRLLHLQRCLAALLGVVVLSAGCTVETTTRRTSRSTRSAPPPTSHTPPPTQSAAPAPAGGTAPASNERVLEQAGVRHNLRVRTAVLPLGTVPYDEFALPLVSPSGRFIATETGAAPEWSTVLADPDAVVADATSVEIHEIDLEGGIRHRVTLPDPVILGRGCDAQGFLVEWQRVDGTRWIGKTDWVTGETRWLVDDDAVNAFAALGPDGQLAWSRRPVDGDYFELVVRRGDGFEWSVTVDEEDYLFPTWSGQGAGLFALRLESGTLDLAYALATDPSTFRQSRKTSRLSSRGSIFLAYQAMNGQPHTVLTEGPEKERLVFYHPAQRRAALWSPRSRSDTGITLLGRGTLTGLLEGPSHVITPTASELWRSHVGNPKQRASLLKGLLIPRPVDDPQWPFMLLTPVEGQRQVGLTKLRLVSEE